MRSKHEIEEIVRNKIETLSLSQSGFGYSTTKLKGKKTIVEVSWGVDNYDDLADIEAAKADLLEHFDETVRLSIVRDITRILEIVAQLESKEDIGEIPHLGSQEPGCFGAICGFSKSDIERLDPQFVKENMASIRQALYESFEYTDKLPTDAHSRWQDQLKEKKKLEKEGAPRSQILMCEREMDIINHQDGKGRFGVNGIPRESLDHCCARWDTQIEEALEEERITGQALGEESLEEQKDTKGKRNAKDDLAVLLQTIAQAQQGTGQTK